MWPLLIIPIIGLLVLTQKPLVFNSADELARASKCQVENISWGIGQKINYKETKGWDTFKACADRGTGDCKCYATMSNEALGLCGYNSLIVILKGHKGTHAVTLFTDKQGNKGFIDGPTNAVFEGVDFDYVISKIPGGPWRRI